MIVRPDKSYETSSLFPNSNWYADEPDNLVVDETTEEGLALAQKILNNYPFYNLVITDGVLTDVELIEPTEQEITPEEPIKTPDQLRIEQLEQDNVSLMLSIADLYEQIKVLKGGTT